VQWSFAHAYLERTIRKQVERLIYVYFRLLISLMFKQISPNLGLGCMVEPFVAFAIGYRQHGTFLRLCQQCSGGHLYRIEIWQISSDCANHFLFSWLCTAPWLVYSSLQMTLCTKINRIKTRCPKLQKECSLDVAHYLFLAIFWMDDRQSIIARPINKWNCIESNYRKVDFRGLYTGLPNRGSTTPYTYLCAT
jgi:hypothetical protein